MTLFTLAQNLCTARGLALVAAGLTLGGGIGRAQLHSDDYESGTVSSFRWERGNGNTAAAVVPSGFAARAGERVAEITWAQANYQGNRVTRGTEGATSSSPRIKKDGWYAFSFRLAPDFPLDRPTIVAQMHAYTPTVDPAKTLSLSVGREGSLGINGYWGIDNRELGVTGGNMLANVAPRGRWMDVIIQVRYSKNGEGVLRVWFDGAPENAPTIERTGINFGSDAWTGDELTHGTYQKFGIYAWDVPSYVAGEVRRVWFDEVKFLVGNPAGAFDLVKPANYGQGRETGAPEAINFSSLGRIDAGSTVIAGFVVTGPGERGVVVRAVGPSLASYGVTGMVTDPRLAVFDARGGVLSENDDWGVPTAGASTLAAHFATAGAFALPAGSRDAGLKLNLPAGSYTAHATAPPGDTGVVMVEVHLLPK